MAKNKEKLPRYKFVIDDDDISTGIRLVSIVADPAIGKKGMYFSKDGKKMVNVEFKTIKDKQMLVGPVLIPNYDIYRSDEDGEYYGYFDEEQIEKMFDRFVKNNNNFSINVDHTSRMVNAYFQSLYIIKDPTYNNARFYGFDLPKGTLFGEVKILDKDFWENEVKGEGKTGFSIEGILSLQPISLSKNYNSVQDYIDQIDEDDLDDINNILNNLKK